MQAFFWLAVRAFTKLGIAMAARRPMMATTIMISTSVKPAFRWLLIFITVSTFLSRRELGRKAVYVIINCCGSFTELPSVDRSQSLAADVPWAKQPPQRQTFPPAP